jgi:hypothetical protein
MISLKQYWMGRDKEYYYDWTNEIQLNAENTVRVANKLLEFVYQDTGVVFNEVASGWRPIEINDDTSNASKTSKHITAQAVDIKDNENRLLAAWCTANPHILKRMGVCMEDAGWTRYWVHWQTVQVESGKTIYIPSTNPPIMPPIWKWKRGDDFKMEVV